MTSPVVFDQFLNRKNEPGLILISGVRGAGKTLWCLALADHARGLGLLPRGLVSPAVMDGAQKIGIDLFNLSSGERRQLAYRKGAADGEIPTKNWQIVTNTLRWGNVLLKSIKTCDLFILDEIGPLEFEQGLGFSAGLDFVDAHREIPCFVVVRPSLLETAQQRWHWARVLDLGMEGKA